MARARKLFPIYGSALANNMLSAIQRDRVVDRFVAAYVAQHDRRGILGGPARERELAETMGREILLAMIVEVREALPIFFGKKQKNKLKTEEMEAIDSFSRELLAALARAQNWNGEDRRQFRRDLSLYSDFSARQEVAAKSRKSGKTPEEEAPFIARVALLLDPSMLEEARRAARKFHGGVGLLARKLLRQTLSPGRR
jgi:predicted RNA-binding Zn ribbon-like protein